MRRKTVKRLLLLAMFLATLLISACGGAGDREAAPTGDSGGVGERESVSGGSYTRVSPAELEAMLENEDFTFVNTHIPFEGNIPGTDLSIPYNEIEGNLALLPADKDAKVVLYCLGGPMSVDAAETLVGLGYTNVWDLAGGMDAWEDAGLPLEEA